MSAIIFDHAGRNYKVELGSRGGLLIKVQVTRPHPKNTSEISYWRWVSPAAMTYELRAKAIEARSQQS